MGADCYTGSYNWMARAYATSIIPVALMVLIWCAWVLRRLFVSSEQVDRRATIFTQHTEASLLLSYVVRHGHHAVLVNTKTNTLTY